MKHTLLTFLLIINYIPRTSTMDCNNDYQLLPLVAAFSTGVVLTGMVAACRAHTWANERQLLLGRVREGEKTIDKAVAAERKKRTRDLQKIADKLNAIIPDGDVEGELPRERAMRQRMESLSLKISEKEALLVSR